MLNSRLPESPTEQTRPALVINFSRRHAIFAAIIMVVWALLYLPHLRESPSWYGDETLTLMIGRSLFDGPGLDRAIKATFWHPSYTYQPGYAWLVGAAAALTSGDILGARSLNISFALITGLFIFFLGSRSFGLVPAFVGSLIFLTYSQTVIHFRWIYPHNAVALAFAIVVLLLIRKSRPRVDIGIGLSLAVATLSHPLFAHGAIATGLCRIKRPSAWLYLVFPPLIALAFGFAWTLSRTIPSTWILEDIKTLGAFYQGFSQEHGSGWQTLQNVLVFYTQDLFHIAAALAAFICLNRRWYQIPIFLLVVSGLLLQNRQNLPIFYYQAVVFLPVMAIAMSAAMHVLFLRLRHLLGESTALRRATWVPLIFPLFAFCSILPQSLGGSLTPRNHPWVTQSTLEVEQAAAWLNARSSPYDLIVCHQNIGWLLKSRTTDFIQATAWSGYPTFTFERLPPSDRFEYPADVRSAKYLVFGDIDQRWTLAQPNVNWIQKMVIEEKWPVVWQGPHYVIVANPGFPVNK